MHGMQRLITSVLFLAVSHMSAQMHVQHELGSFQAGSVCLLKYACLQQAC